MKQIKIDELGCIGSTSTISPPTVQFDSPPILSDSKTVVRDHLVNTCHCVTNTPAVFIPDVKANVRTGEPCDRHDACFKNVDETPPFDISCTNGIDKVANFKSSKIPANCLDGCLNMEANVEFSMHTGSSELDPCATPFVPGLTYHPRPARIFIPGHSVVCESAVKRSIKAWMEELELDWNRNYLINGLQNGFNLIDSPSTLPSCNRSNYKSTTGLNAPKVEEIINNELLCGNYIKTKVKPHIVSSLGAVPKDLSDIRLIHDLSRPNGGVNELSWYNSVQYITVDDATRSIKPGSHIAKVDLKSAYRHIPIHPSNYGLTGIKWLFKNDTDFTYMYDAKLPFGGAKSCAVFSAITDSITRMMARKGFTIFNYIDDILCVGATLDSCKLCFDTLIELLERLGLTINWEKVTHPTQKLTFLGVVLDCTNRTLALPESKVAQLKIEIANTLKVTKIQKLELQRLLGRLNWAARVIRGGRSFMRRLIDSLPKVKENHHHLRLGLEAKKKDLSWWQHGLDIFNGTCLFIADVSLPSRFFTTDACLTGGGSFMDKDWVYVNWSQDCPKMIEPHINVLELKIVEISLIRWGSQFRGKHVKIKSDNKATVSALNKTTSKSSQLMDIVRNIYWLSLRYDFLVSAEYLPGEQNILADRLSRLAEFKSACEARYILANGRNVPISCKYHMSIPAFRLLQETWTRALDSC